MEFFLARLKIWLQLLPNSYNLFPLCLKKNGADITKWLRGADCTMVIYQVYSKRNSMLV